jgi:hypothetical protein
MPRGILDDRRNEPWPTVDLGRDVEYLPQTPTEAAKNDALRNAMAPFPPITPMALQAGVNDIKPISDQELLMWIINNAATMPYSGPKR